jgi:hypothetical protein
LGFELKSFNTPQATLNRLLYYSFGSSKAILLSSLGKVNTT